MSQSLGFVNVVDEFQKVQHIRYDVFVSLLFKQMSPEMMKAHAAMLVAGESGELVDAIKKEIIYGQPPDLANIIEELGDLRFGIQSVMNLYSITETEILQSNANKLAARYKGLTYSDQAAKDRADKSPPTMNIFGDDC